MILTLGSDKSTVYGCDFVGPALCDTQEHLLKLWTRGQTAQKNFSPPSHSLFVSPDDVVLGKPT